MMGPSHSLSGAAVWLTASAIGASFVDSATTPLAVIALGTAVCAGAALGPDIDSHSSTAVNSFGVIGKAGHEVANTFSLLFYNLTRTKYDSPKNNGHRTLTHTTVFAILVGVIVSLLAFLPGSVSIAGKVFGTGQLWSLFVMFIFLHLGLAGIFEKQVKKARKKYGPYLLMVASAVLTVITATFLPENDTYGWLGAAVAVGFFVHTLGDLITRAGVPLVWPLKVNGKRWFDVRPPSFLTFRAGSGFEYGVMVPLFLIVIFVSAAYHIPGAPNLLSYIGGLL